MNLEYPDGFDSISKFLGIPGGCCSFNGGGGKSSIICAVSADRKNDERIIVTTSTHISIPCYCPTIDPLNIESAEVCEQRHGLMAVGHAAPKGKITTPMIPIDSLVSVADKVLVEADGSKGKPVKIPNATEPVYNHTPQRIFCVVGLTAVGKKFEDACFRYKPGNRVTEKGPSEAICPADIADLICKPEGMLWNIPKGIPVTVVLNQADNVEARKNAMKTAEMICHPSITRVVTVSLIKDFGGKYAHCCERRR